MNIVLAAVLLGSFFQARPPLAFEGSLKDLSENPINNRKVLKAALTGRSSKDIHNYLIKEFESKDSGQQHEIMHILGELLYEKAGKNGMLICGSDFGTVIMGFFLRFCPEKGLMYCRNWIDCVLRNMAFREAVVHTE